MKILLVGFGNMGSAMLHGWWRAGILRAGNTIVVARALPLKNLDSEFQPISYLQAAIDAIDADAIKAMNIDFAVLAVRPQIMATILPSYKKFADAGVNFMTVAAGLQDEFYRNILGDNIPVIRIMPNMPTAIGLGMNGIYYNKNVSDNAKERNEDLMKTLGGFEILAREGDMDAFTALAGSGPAYAYLLVEAMAKAAIKLGINPESAEEIAIQTVIGAGKYLQQHSDNATGLRHEVALPGGVTEAALNVFLENDAMVNLVGAAMEAATARSKKMATEMAK